MIFRGLALMGTACIVRILPTKIFNATDMNLSRVNNMPIKDYKQTQLFLKTENGEYHPVSASIEECAEMVSDVDSAWNNPECFKGGEITFEIPWKECKRLKRYFNAYSLDISQTTGAKCTIYRLSDGGERGNET